MLTTNERVKLIYGGILCFFGSFALLGVAMAGFQAREAAVTLQNNADKITTAAVARMDALQKPTDEAYGLIRSARQAVDHVDRAAIDQRIYFERQLPATMGRLDEILASAKSVTDASAATMDEATLRLRNLEPVENNAAKVLHDADVVVSDPHIAAMVVHADDAAAATSQAAKRVSGIALDARVISRETAKKKTPWFLRIFGF